MSDAAIEAEGPLEIGLTGATLAARRGEERLMVKRLPAGRPFPPDAASPVAWRQGEVNGSPALVAPWQEGAPAGALVGWSPQQERAVRAARELDPEQEHGHRLRKANLQQRVLWMAGLAQTVADLHAEGRRVPLLTPWNLLFTPEGFVPLEVDLGLSAAELDERVSGDVLVFLAPEVVAAIQDGADGAGPGDAAADVYALAATIRALLLCRVPEPAAGDGDRAARARGGMELDGQQTFSRKLDGVLASALAPSPDRRPAAADFAAQLRAIGESGTVVWEPPSPTLLYVTLAAVLLVALAAVATLAPSPLARSRSEFARASRLDDLQERQLRVVRATDPGGDGLLPEARELRAVTALRRWSLGHEERAEIPPRPLVLSEVLDDLERDVVANGPDSLGHAAALVAGVLRSWELDDPGAQERAVELLNDVALGSEPSLTALAKAARAFTATGPRPTRELSDAWLPALEGIGEASPLVAPQPLVDEATYGAKPAPKPVSLDSGWVIDLIVGRLRLQAGDLDGAVESLQKAFDRVPAFSARFALARALARRGNPEDIAAARDQLNKAAAQRDLAEVHLELGLLALRELDLEGDAEQARATLEAASTAFAAALAATPDLPDTLQRARVGQAQVDLWQALLRTPAASEARLAELIQEAEQRPALKALQVDLHAARGLALAKLGQPAAAREELSHLFVDQDMAAGWADLPALDPAPPTRDRQTVLRVLLAGSLDEVEGMLGRVSISSATIQVAETTLGPALEKLRSLAEAEGVDPLPAILARARLALARAREGDAASAPAVAKGREALAALEGRLEPAKEPERWLAWLKGTVEASRCEADLNPEVLGVVVARLSEACNRLTAAADGAPENVAEEVGELLAQEAPRLRARIAPALSGWLEQRARAWSRLRPTGPAPEGAAADAAALRDAAAALTGAGDAGENGPLAARALEAASRLATAAGDRGAGVAAARRGRELIGDADADLAKALDLALGEAAASADPAVQAALGEGSDPWGVARDALARAGGFADFKAVAAASKKGAVKWAGPKGRSAVVKARLIAALVAQARALLPDSVGPGTRVAGSARMYGDLSVAIRLSPGDPAPRVEQGRIELARHAKGNTMAARAAGHALQAYNMAVRGIRARKPYTEALIRAAALYAEAKATAEGAAAIRAASFGQVARTAARYAERLIAAKPALGELVVLRAPAYWAARRHLELARAAEGEAAKAEAAKAADAYRAFGEGLGALAPPRVAGDWANERAEAERGR